MPQRVNLYSSVLGSSHPGDISESSETSYPEGAAQHHSLHENPISAT